VKLSVEGKGGWRDKAYVSYTPRRGDQKRRRDGDPQKDSLTFIAFLSALLPGRVVVQFGCAGLLRSSS
jgi:hypothetical protein